MSVLIGSDRFGLFVDGSEEAEYVAEVLALNPMAYWILGEHEGTVAYEQIDPVNQNGTHSGVTLGADAGVGDGQVAPFYDGAASRTDLGTATFLAAFNGSEGTLLTWLKVANAAVWTDGAARRALSIVAPAYGNYAIIGKSSVNNTLAWEYNAGGTVDTRTNGGYSATTWMCLAMTWSATDDEVIAYYDGAQVGAVMTGLGVWSADPTIAAVASDAAGVNLGHGYIAHCAVWSSALTPAQIAALATT